LNYRRKTAKGTIAVGRRSVDIIGQEDMVLTTKMKRGRERDMGQEEMERETKGRVIGTDHDEPSMATREASSTVHENTGMMKVVGTIAEGLTAILHQTTSTTIDGRIARADGISLWTESQIAVNQTTTNVGLREIVPFVIESQIPHSCTISMDIVCRTLVIVKLLVVCITFRCRPCSRNSGITKYRGCVPCPMQGIPSGIETER
jgi:hypothetical protein